MDRCQIFPQYSKKYAAGGQLGVIINKAESQNIAEISGIAKNFGLDILGTIPVDKELLKGSITRDSDIVKDALKHLYSRLNLPQENN